MRKIIISVLVLVALLSFASLKDEWMKAVNEINSIPNLPWRAGYFEGLDKYEGLASSLDELFDKWTGTRPLPKEIKDKFIRNLKSFKLTSTNDMFMATKFIYTYQGETLPASFIQVHTVVKDQGWHGTCWAFSTTAAMESAILVQLNNEAGGSATDPTYYAKSDIDLSEQFVGYHNIDWDLLVYEEGYVIQDSNADVGGNPYFATYNLIRYGIPDEWAFPYIGYDNSPWIKWNPLGDWKSTLQFSAKTAVILDYETMRDAFGMTYDEYINTIKEAIKRYGALSVMFKVPSRFYEYKEGVYVPTTDIYTGGHAVALVGWFDIDTLKELGWVDKDAASVTYTDPFTRETVNATLFWVIKNSWGPSWGWNGYYVVPAITKEQYERDDMVADWQIEFFNMYVPIIGSDSVINTDADFNDDGKVNEDDWNELTNALWKTKEDSDWTSYKKYDLTKDGKIDGTDLEAFMGLWNNYNQ